MAKNLLEVHGIPSFIDEHAFPVAEHTGTGQVRLLVAPTMASQVRDLLPNKTRLVDVPDYPPPVASDYSSAYEKGDLPAGSPSASGVVFLLCLALALGLVWVIVTIFVL